MPERSNMSISSANTNSKALTYILRFGFGGILILTVLLGYFAIVRITVMTEIVENVVELHNVKTFAAMQMRDSIRQRQISLHKMSATQDLFERDQLLQQFYVYAGKYRRNREILLNMGMDEVEKAFHKRLTLQTRESQPSVRLTAEMLMEDISHEELVKFIDVAFDKMQLVFTMLDELVGLQQNYNKNAVKDARKEQQKSFSLTLIFSACVIILGFLIANAVSHYVTVKSNELTLKNSELARAYTKAEEATLAKSEFLANMSHEIRTPLTAIIGFTEVILDPKLAHDVYCIATDSILRNSKHLLQTINNILDISKIEAGQLGLEPIKTFPIQVMAEMESIIGTLARQKGLTFNIEYELPIPKCIVTDPTRLKQILINLAGNAIKFTHAGGITISLSSRIADQLLCIKVKDTGIGVNATELKNIFKAFAQADNTTTRRYGGTGLGLSISVQLAQMLGGSLRYESNKDNGSIFILMVATGSLDGATFVTDINQEMAEYPLKNTTEIKPLQGRLLLAEDSKDNQHLITLILQKIGLEVKVVENGEQATREALANPFDLILMDMQMPVMDGIEAITQLRDHGYTKPIVSLTANAMKSDWETCIAAGANDYLTKPIEIERFYSVLSSYLPLAENIQNELCPAQTNVQYGTLNDDPEFQQLIKSFLQKLPDMLKELTEAIADNWEGARIVAHKLKGIGGGLGFPEITQVAGAIDHCIRSQHYGQAENEIEKLIDVCEKIMLTYAKT